MEQYMYLNIFIHLDRVGYATIVESKVEVNAGSSIIGLGDSR